MDSLLALVAAFLFWRTALVVVVAFVAAVILARHTSWFSGGYGVALVLVAFGAGLLWEGSARSQDGEPPAAAIKLSPLVATLGLAFFGAVAGGWASAAAGSVAAGAVALVIAAAAVGVYKSRVEKRKFAWWSFAHSTLALLAGFGCLVLLGKLRV